MTALEVEDVRERVECHAQRVLCDGVVQEQVVAGYALATEVGALLAQVVGER